MILLIVYFGGRISLSTNEYMAGAGFLLCIFQNSLFRLFLIYLIVWYVMAFSCLLGYSIQFFLPRMVFLEVFLESPFFLLQIL